MVNFIPILAKKSRVMTSLNSKSLLLDQSLFEIPI